MPSGGIASPPSISDMTETINPEIKKEFTDLLQYAKDVTNSAYAILYLQNTNGLTNAQNSIN